MNGGQDVVCWLYFRGQILYFWCFNVYMDMNLVDIKKKRGKKTWLIFHTWRQFFFCALLNAHIFKTIECIPPPPDDIHHVCLRVFECVRVCPQQLFVFCTKKKHPRILKHFGFCILKCFISFSPLIFFYSFHSKLEIKFFFFSDIFSWHPLFSSTAQPSVVDLAAAWQPCTVQHINRLLSGRMDGRTDREREGERENGTSSRRLGRLGLTCEITFMRSVWAAVMISFVANSDES